MRRRALIIAAATLSLSSVSAAWSAEPAGKDVGQYVDLQPVAVPIIARGQLLNYVFVYVRLNLSTTANAARLREKEPFFRDALVRAAHRTPFTLASDYNKIDEGKLSATLLREATAFAGPGQVRNVVVTSQAPRRRVATPRT